MADYKDIYASPKSNLSTSASGADKNFPLSHGNWSKGMKIVMTAPPLITFNGIGFRLYGKSYVDMEKTSYIATYYFTFCFLPVIPLNRYVITLDANGGPQVSASLPLKAIDKIHLFGVVLLTGIGCAALFAK